MLRCDDVFAVIVTYNPHFPSLEELLESLLPQVGRAIVVDNGSSNGAAEWLLRRRDQNLELHLEKQNLGVAAAQNIGIEAARATSASYVLLSDQDSRPAANMVQRLHQAACELARAGHKVAAVGPRYLDARQDNPPPFIRIEGLRLIRQTAEKPDAIVRVDYLISSGSLIPLEAIDAIGSMNGDLFVDYVDIEWGLRAKAGGYQSFGIFAAAMSHSLGEEPARFFGKNYPVHSPLRHYYLARNSTWLCKQSYVPFNWKIVESYRMWLRIAFYSTVTKPQHKHFTMMIRGVVDGLTSRLGPI